MSFLWLDCVSPGINMHPGCPQKDPFASDPTSWPSNGAGSPLSLLLLICASLTWNNNYITAKPAENCMAIAIYINHNTGAVHFRMMGWKLSAGRQNLAELLLRQAVVWTPVCFLKQWGVGGERSYAAATLLGADCFHLLVFICQGQCTPINNQAVSERDVAKRANHRPPSLARC